VENQNLNCHYRKKKHSACVNIFLRMLTMNYINQLFCKYNENRFHDLYRDIFDRKSLLSSLHCIIYIFYALYFTYSCYWFKCLSHRKPCKIQNNVAKLISVRKNSCTFSKYLMPSILKYIIHISYIFSFLF
jgi:hypothetical protein